MGSLCFVLLCFVFSPPVLDAFLDFWGKGLLFIICFCFLEMDSESVGYGAAFVFRGALLTHGASLEGSSALTRFFFLFLFSIFRSMVSMAADFVCLQCMRGNDPPPLCIL